nr:MAG TPA: Sarcoglycan complex subunit protein [Caudoviricetes sp.]
MNTRKAFSLTRILYQYCACPSIKIQYFQGF